MPARLDARLCRLEAQTTPSAWLHGEGLAALLASARRQGITAEHVPLASLTPTELDAKIEDLQAQVAAGARGFTRLHLEALVLYRKPPPSPPQQAAQAKEPSA